MKGSPMGHAARARVWLVATGLVTLWGQVVLLRELIVAFYGSELVVLLGLGVLMLSTAAGALLGRPLRPPSEAAVGRAFLAFAAALPLLVVLLRSLRVLFGGVPGADLPVGQQLAGLALSLLPFGLLAGLLFQRSAARFTEAGGTPGRAYALESLGSLVGGLAATALIAAGVQNLAAALLCAAMAGGVAGAADGPRIASQRALSWCVVAALGVALVFSSGLDRWLTGLNLPGLLVARDTPYGRTAVAGRLGQVAVFEDGALVAESQGTSAEAFVHIAALQCAAPRNVLLLGGTAEGLTEQVLKHSPERVDLVEIDHRAQARIEPLLPPDARAALSDPRVMRSFTDPRRFLPRGGTYDLILSAAPEPTSGRANRFYTREFFRLVRAHLSADGVFAFRLRSAENLWSKALAVRNESVLLALRGAFPHVLVLPGAEDLVLASGSSLVRDPEALIIRMRERRVESRLVTAPYIVYLLTNDRVAGAERLLGSTSAPENTDARPACYPCTLLLWLARFFPSLGTSAPEGDLPLPWLAFPPLVFAGLSLATRKRKALRPTVFMAAAGFAGMVLEGALLLSYQTRCGALYQDLGVLITCFMGGLALGAWVSDRPPVGGKVDTGLGLTIAASTTAAAVLCVLATGWELPFGRAVTGALLVGTGACVGAAFAWAGRGGEDPGPRRTASLYAADLAGGCLGALLGSALYLPFAGLPGSAAMAALTGLVMALLV
jgi:spermidine synthase